MPENYDCAAWGPLDPDHGFFDHPDCPVVITAETGVASQATEKTIPRVCRCECTVCKRAWWSQGRPKIVDGKVLRFP